MNYAHVLASQYNEHQLLEMFRQYGNRVFKVAADIKAIWERQELMQILEESKQVPHKAVCTTSIGDGESSDEDTDWRERYESTREAPYGCLTEDDMKTAIMENDLNIIEESPVLANITLGNMLREDPDLESELDERIRGNYTGSDLGWDDVTNIPRDAFTMIEEQRSLSPKRQTWKDQRKLSRALLEIF